MRSIGVAPRKLLAGTGLDVRQVVKGDHLISLEQYQTIVWNMLRLSKNNGIGFQLADTVKPSDFGIVGYALLSSQTLRQALRVWMEYSNSLVGSSIRLVLVDDKPSGYTLTMTSRSSLEAMRRFETEELLADMRMIPLLTGITPVVRGVCFDYARPAHDRLYEDFFKCPIEFDCDQTILSVRTPNLDVPIQSRNQELYEVCSEHCQRVMRALPQGGVVRSRLRSLFLTSPSRLPELDEAARKLGVTERTLRRELEADGQSYQRLKDEFRFDLAQEYLFNGHLAPKEIAHLLGYSSPSAFSRAFKAWTGTTVRKFVK